MDIWNYNSDGILIGKGVADADPKSNGGSFLIPAFATPLQPPTFDAQTHLARWEDGAWKIEAIPAAPEPDPPTPEMVQAAMTSVVQLHMDTVARSWGYDSIASAVTYADEPAVEQFQLEGRSLRAWRSLVWADCYEKLGAVTRQERPIPTAEELIYELPGIPERP